MKDLLKQYNKRKKEIKKRLKEFSLVQDHFYELCFCLLTPQSNAYRCDECVQILREKDFLNKKFDIRGILRLKTRFYNNKSGYLLLVKENHKKIFDSLKKIKDNKSKREYLVKNVKGMGMKEASHFLRNIGYRDLAILDRHIIKNLIKLKVIKEVPKSLTERKYLEIEEKFYDFSRKINIPMDELDLLFWSIETGKIFK